MEVERTYDGWVEQKLVSGVEELLNTLLAQSHQSVVSPLHEVSMLSLSVAADNNDRYKVMALQI